MYHEEQHYYMRIVYIYTHIMYMVIVHKRQSSRSSHDSTRCSSFAKVMVSIRWPFKLWSIRGLRFVSVWKSPSGEKEGMQMISFMTQ